MKAYENEKNYISEVTAKMEEVLSKGIINSSEVSNLSSDSNCNDSEIVYQLEDNMSGVIFDL